MKYVLRRLAFFVLTLWICITVNFLLPRFMPGNSASDMMARYQGRVSGTAYKALAINFGTDKHESLLPAYWHYLGSLFTGRLGTSLAFFPKPVTSVLASALPWTLGLVGVTTVIAFVLGTLLGMVSAWRKGSRLDNLLPPLFVLLSGFPYFFLALLAILLFSVKLGWLPYGSGYTTGLQLGWSGTFILDVLNHSILPALTIVIVSLGTWVLTMRNSMLGTLGEDYVTMARAKGLSSTRIMFHYAGRNAILPNLTGFAMSLGFVVSGSVLVEYVFAYPGVGYMLLQSVQNGDYALMQALFLLITVCVLVAVLVTDFVTVAVDPRVRMDTGL